MPRFFFDYPDNPDRRDQEGIELPDAAAAEREVMQTLPLILADEMTSEVGASRCSILVRNEQGVPIFSAAVSYTGARLAKAT